MKLDLINAIAELPKEIRYSTKEMYGEYNFILKLGCKNGSLYLKYELDNYTNWNNPFFKPSNVEYFICDYLIYFSWITNDDDMKLVIRDLLKKILEWKESTDFKILYN